MASPLDQFGEDQTRRDNADVAGAHKSLSWAETFRSTPPANVLRARANYADAIDRAFTNKINLEARTSLKAMELKAKTAEYQEDRQLFPLKEQALQARIEATGAAERRRAQEAALEAAQSAALNRGISELYSKGFKRGSPEFVEYGSKLLSENPMADPGNVLEIGKALGLDGETPEEKIAHAVRLTTEREKARLALQPSAEEKIGEAVAKKKALMELDPQTDKASESEIKALERDRKLYADMLNRAEGRRNTAKEEDTKLLYDQDIREFKSKLNDTESQLRSLRTGAPAAAPGSTTPGVPVPADAAPAKITSAADFAALPSGSEFIDPQGVKRRKP